MVLNGWKDIAAHLKCGVRAAQQYQRLGLPVIRLRKGNKARVKAVSEELDDWVRNRSSRGENPLRPSLAANIDQTIALRKKTSEQYRAFITTELSTGRQFAELADESRDPQSFKRRRSAALAAYETIAKLLARRPEIPEKQMKSFKTELQELKKKLDELGRKF